MTLSPPSAPRISIIIPTRDRPAALARMLASLLRDPAGVALVDEVLVILSGAADTAAAVDVPGLPLRHVAEPRGGVGIARNRGIAEAGGELLIWFDDDVEVTPGSIAAFAKGAADWPMAAMFSGRSQAYFEAPPPDWMPALLEMSPSVYAQLDLGPAARPMREEDHEFPFGCIMALRKSRLGSLRFGQTLGRGADLGPGFAGHLVGGEETALVRALMAAGQQVVWLPGAHVRHWITPDRMTIAHLRKFFFGVGVELALTGRAFADSSLTPLQLRRRFRIAAAKGIGNTRRWLRLLSRYEIIRGQRAALLLKKRPEPAPAGS